MRTTTSLFILLIFHSTTLFGQDTESLNFLKIGNTAHHFALNEGTTSIAINGSDILVNPALISAQVKSGINVNYTKWIGETFISTASLIYRKDDRVTYGLNIISNSTSNIEARDIPGDPSGTFSVDYLSIAAAYSRNFTFVSIGLTGNYIFEHYLQNSASGYAFNVGFYKNLVANKLSIGGSVNHLGKMSKLNQTRSKLPAEARFGVNTSLISLSTPGYRNIPLVIDVGVDARIALNKTNSSNDLETNDQIYVLTIKPRIGDVISIATGFRIDESERLFSAGLGIHNQNFQFDIAYIPFSSGYNNRFSIGASYLF